jgi:hypothetical protein
MRQAKEPTRRELLAIEAEWPLIAAELAVVDAEVAELRGLDARIAARFEAENPDLHLNADLSENLVTAGVVSS